MVTTASDNSNSGSLLVPPNPAGRAMSVITASPAITKDDASFPGGLGSILAVGPLPDGVADMAAVANL